MTPVEPGESNSPLGSCHREGPEGTPKHPVANDKTSHLGYRPDTESSQ
jgi:hypothetical protein